MGVGSWQRPSTKPHTAFAPRAAFIKPPTNVLAMSSSLVGPLAAWMPPSSPHGRVYGVSRKR
ncbi:hypothetical protein B1H41_05310 [Xanthomonas vasicola pv. vasculorum]|nr:hypothetical protein B1H41_05310 [Xanthomonas vasicola pv. vasculorum]OWF64909.1 hypothetical protein B1H32_00830 [Xanthomonas vasicola pv. vasculorum]PDM35720.1 hypothetical protein CQW50_04435 [Xanthomonas vasicola pv. vasculorum]